MILLQFSSAQGPAECELAVLKGLACLQRESALAGVRVEVLEQEDGEHPGTLRSALVSLEGDAEAAVAQRWEGTIQWTCPSPYRPRHARKNWFFGVARCAAPAATATPHAPRGPAAPGPAADPPATDSRPPTAPSPSR